MICKKCKEEITVKTEEIKCSKCKSEFHVSCTRLQTVDNLNKLMSKRNGISKWKCDECDPTVSDNVSVSSQSDSEQNKDRVVIELLKTVQRELKESREDNRVSFTELNGRMNVFSETIVKVTNRVDTAELEIVNIKQQLTELENENRRLVNRVADLEYSNVNMQQYSRRQNLEIRGIPFTNNEDVYEVLQGVARALGVTFKTEDISIAHRLGKPNPEAPYPPAIVVQFVSRSTRNTWLLNARQKKIKTTDIHNSLRPGPVYICDQLSPHDRRVLRFAKTYVRGGQLHSAWVSDGKVMIRQREESKPSRVWFEYDVEKLLGRRSTANNNRDAFQGSKQD